MAISFRKFMRGLSLPSRRGIAGFEQRSYSDFESVRFWSREDSSRLLRGVGAIPNYSYFLDSINLNSGVQ